MSKQDIMDSMFTGAYKRKMFAKQDLSDPIRHRFPTPEKVQRPSKKEDK